MRILIVTLLCLSVFAASAQETRPAIAPELLEQMALLEEATAVLRGLEAIDPIERAFPTREETIAFLQDQYSEASIPEADMQRSIDFYVALGFMPNDIDLRQVILDLLGSQVAGFYDTETRTMNVIPLIGDSPGESLSLLEQTIYVHEYVHALQDMHYDLDTLLPDDLTLTQPDRALAIISLVEGDATAIMQLYLQEAASTNPLSALSMLGESAAAGALAMPTGFPDILTRELLFPYEAGLSFVIEIWSDGGWDAVNAAYAAPPVSSEQIIHPEKYLSGETPIVVAPLDVSPGEGWSQTWDTTLGEFYLREYLRGLVEFETAAARAATGWGGDSFRVWRKGADRAFALSLAFDSAEDVEEFVTVYGEATGAFADGCGSAGAMVVCARADGTTVHIGSAPDVTLAGSLVGG
jgi:hypothetical protein